VDAWQAVLALAFGLGVLHAFDADHIMTVSGLVGLRGGTAAGTLRRTLRYCSRWAIGHGLTLFLLGGVAIGLGVALPEALGTYAEAGVGVFLVGLGIATLWRLRKQKVHLHFHRHRSLPLHAHWHAHAGEPTHAHGHGAILVGMMHGTAGSAGVLALLPVAALGRPGLALAYLLLFALGVLVAMLAVGGALGRVFALLANKGERVHTLMRALLGIGALTLGSYWLYGLR
jgi:nickel/cobalt exporter